MNDGDIQDVGMVYFTFLLPLIFWIIPPPSFPLFFCDGLGAFGVGIASHVSERVWVRKYDYAQIYLP